MEIVTGIEIFGLLFAAGAVAGFVDTLAGGGGLITLPALLFFQLPMVNALATNRFQAVFGTLTATLTMIRRHVIHIRDVGPLFVSSLVGSVIGTYIVLEVDTKFLDKTVPIFLLCVSAYFLAVPHMGEIEREPAMSRALYRLTVISFIGLYDGMIGPGSGSFFSLAGVSLRGQSLVRATAIAKALDLAANIASLMIFALSEKVLWFAGAAMIVGQIAGAYLASLVIVKGGAKIIRLAVVLMCSVMLVKYLWRGI